MEEELNELVELLIKAKNKSVNLIIKSEDDSVNEYQLKKIHDNIIGIIRFVKDVNPRKEWK